MTSTMSRRCNNPPAKFSFLSGIHPDLDDALCEAQFKSPSFESHPCEEAVRPRSDLSRRSSGGGGGRQSLSRLEQLSVSSKPREITCSALNESVESLPFSIDGMEKAKRKLKSQAARIRDLEAELERVASSSSIISSNEGSFRKVLSPQERLEAHKERKRKENRHKEVSGKWDSPPPLRKNSLTSKVSRDDEFVDRLAADPKERRRQDEIKRRVSRTKERYSRGSSDAGAKERDSSPLVRRMSIEEEIRKTLKKKKNNDKQKRIQRNSREDLMKRLNMTVEERRGTERNRALAAAKRVNANRQSHHRPPSSQSHKSHGSNDEFMVRDITNRPNDNYREVKEEETRTICNTCGSSQDCEEDTDSPGVFYCARCWEEYENNSSTHEGFEEENYTEEHDEDESSSHANYGQIHDTEEVQAQNRGIENALWIVHDNPKLGGRLLSSGGNKMSCFVETKDPRSKNCVRILHGRIDYSGPVPRQSRRPSSNRTDRGAECIRMREVNGYIIHHDKVETRLAQNKSVYEFQLDPNKSIRLTGASSQMTLKDFLHDCIGSVDVILDPQSSPGNWYPLREASGSSRKIAPQFRSKGVGYIRLGDDMGNNGLAFLSDDNCRTFFSTEPIERMDDSNSDMLKTVASFSSKPSYRSNSPRRASRRKTSQSYNKRPQRISRSSRSTARSTSTGSTLRDVQMVETDDEDDSTIASCSSESHTMNAGEVLKELQNIEVAKDMKWKDKADLLIKLGKAVSRPEGRSRCETALSYIQDVISAKNVNIHVLRSALLVVEKIGFAMEEELPDHIAWKTIMIEILKLLKNKQCGGGAREILQKLHGKCYTLATSLTAISHVLGIGKVANQRKLSSWKGHTTPQQNKPPMKANNVEVIEWLAVTTEAERAFDDIRLPMDASELSLLANFFLSHESHRDARCRKNALDGLLHTMLYAVDVLEMNIDEAQSLCIELKTVKPRSWARLMKSLQMVIRMERRR